MHSTAERFAERVLDEYDLSIDPQEFPSGTKTAADAADAVDCDLAQIVKSIVMIADGETIVVLTSGANRVDEAALAAELGADDVRSATPDEVKAATGWSIGGVPPFCHDTEIQTLVDETLLGYDDVWAAAGTPEAMFSLSPDTLIEIAEPKRAAVFE